MVVQERCRRCPIPDLLSPVRIGRVIGIASESSRKLEKTTIGNGILDVVSRFISEDLPAKPTTTRCRIPSANLRVEYTLGKGKPGESVLPVRELQFGGGHGS